MAMVLSCKDTIDPPLDKSWQTGMKACGYCQARVPVPPQYVLVVTTCDNHVLVSKYQICGDDYCECAYGGCFISCMLTYKDDSVVDSY